MRLMPLLLSGPVLLRPLVLPLAVAALAAGWSVPAAADVWAYVDARGESHFATEQLDERYELFFRSAESFDTRRDPPPSPRGPHHHQPPRQLGRTELEPHRPPGHRRRPAA